MDKHAESTTSRDSVDIDKPKEQNTLGSDLLFSNVDTLLKRSPEMVHQTVKYRLKEAMLDANPAGIQNALNDAAEACSKKPTLGKAIISALREAGSVLREHGLTVKVGSNSGEPGGMSISIHRPGHPLGVIFYPESKTDAKSSSYKYYDKEKPDTQDPVAATAKSILDNRDIDPQLMINHIFDPISKIQQPKSNDIGARVSQYFGVGDPAIGGELSDCLNSAFHNGFEGQQGLKAIQSLTKMVNDKLEASGSDCRISADTDWGTFAIKYTNGDQVSEWGGMFKSKNMLEKFDAE
jgi:hypothetical protein